MELDHDQCSGSAFLVDHAGKRGCRYLFTNFHVIEANKTKQVLLFFPKLGKKPIKGHVKRAYPQSDLAIIEVPSKEAKRLKGIPNLEISRETVPKFTTAYALGFPLGCDDVQISEGIISGWEDMHYHMNISINSGNSGGPVLIHTEAGERVIAVSVATLCGAEAIGLGIPMIFLDDILAIHSENILCLEAKTQCTVRGPTIMTMHERDLLYQMGFRKGDRVRSINGLPVDAFGDMRVEWTELPITWTDGNVMRRQLTRGGTAEVDPGRRTLTWGPIHGGIPSVRELYPFYEDIECRRVGSVVFVKFSMNLVPLANANTVTKDLALCAIDPTHCHDSRVVISYIDTFSETYIKEQVELFDVLTHVDGRPVRTLEDIPETTTKRKRHTYTLNDVITFTE